jgi:hypothetical protein
MNDTPSQSQDKFIVRLPTGLRDRIRRSAEANARSMNAEIVAALLDWFPDPTAEEYLVWLHRELETMRQRLESPKMPDDAKVVARERATAARKKMIEVIDGKADPSTFEESIAQLSDFYAMHR